MNYSELLHRAIVAAVLAGHEILEVYDTNFQVEYKEDRSPLTEADKRSSAKIVEELQAFGIPVLSEEGEEIPYATRQVWSRLWIVDPLDGTKEFVKRNGEFTVNIALVEDHEPVLGVIYSPVFKDLYFAAKGLGAYKIDRHDFLAMEERIHTFGLEALYAAARRLPSAPEREAYVVVASRSHMSTETYRHIEALKREHAVVDIVTSGSSIKMCLVAEGTANEYPRFGPTMEWDTAAGQAILQEAGASLLDLETGSPMRYNRENLLNHWFMAKRG